MVEPDPLRRLRLNISYTKLEEMHPADLADIVEELGPAEREAIFETIDSESAADALSEVENPKMQASILESLEPERPPRSSRRWRPTRLLISSELEDETSEEILEEMDSAPKLRPRTPGIPRGHRWRHDEHRVRLASRQRHRG